MGLPIIGHTMIAEVTTDRGELNRLICTFGGILSWITLIADCMGGDAAPECHRNGAQLGVNVDSNCASENRMETLP